MASDKIRQFSKLNKIALLTSGGDSSGMNAVIRSVTRTALYFGLEVYGVKQGYIGLIANDFNKLTHSSVAKIINLGGTVLMSGRSQAFYTPQGLQTAAANLQRRDIDGLIVIGGDGSMRGAHLLQQQTKVKIVGIPATIDNDILGSDYSIGFDTATNTAVQAIDKIRDTAEAFNRLFLIEVMGRNSGNIALNSGIACGAEHILLPAKIESIEQVLQLIDTHKRRQKTIHLIVVAEGEQFSIEVLAQAIKQQFSMLDVRTCRLGHIQRGGQPTQYDRVQASRLGYAAVLALLANKKDVMLGTKHAKITYVALSKVTTKIDNLDPDALKMLNILAS